MGGCRPAERRRVRFSQNFRFISKGCGCRRTAVYKRKTIDFTRRNTGSGRINFEPYAKTCLLFNLKEYNRNHLGYGDFSLRERVQIPLLDATYKHPTAAKGHLLENLNIIDPTNILLDQSDLHMDLFPSYNFVLGLFALIASFLSEEFKPMNTIH